MHVDDPPSFHPPSVLILLTLLSTGDFLWTVEPLVIIFVGPLIYRTTASQQQVLYLTVPTVCLCIASMQSLIYSIHAFPHCFCSSLKRRIPSSIKQASVTETWGLRREMVMVMVSLLTQALETASPGHHQAAAAEVGHPKGAGGGMMSMSPPRRERRVVGR